MAFMRKLPTGKFAVYWNDSNKTRHQKNFSSKAEAKQHLAMLELSPQKRQSTITLATLMANYRDTETVKKRGSRSETLRINALMRRPFASKVLADITPSDIQEFIDSRLQEPGQRKGTTISAATVIKEAHLLGTIFHFAQRQGLITDNLFKDIQLPKEPEHRERIASDEDIEKILISSGWDGESVPTTQLQLVAAAFLFACKTGMRAGEILAIEESWIDGRVIHLPKEATKTESKRDVALSKEALRILDLVRQSGGGRVLFSNLPSNIRDALWRKIRDRAGLGPVFDSKGRLIKEGLNFHDSRATFATWAASPDPKTGAPRLGLLALARQTGHKNLKMLQRYYRASAKDVALMLDA